MVTGIIIGSQCSSLLALCIMAEDVGLGSSGFKSLAALTRLRCLKVRNYCPTLLGNGRRPYVNQSVVVMDWCNIGHGTVFLCHVSSTVRRHKSRCLRSVGCEQNYAARMPTRCLRTSV